MPLFTRLEDEYGDNVRFVFRHFPLSMHDKAQLAAEAAEAAGAQGAFWEMHDRIYEKQRQWTMIDPARARETFIAYAADLGLDVERFAADLDRGAYRDVVRASYREAEEQQLYGTPVLFINGQLFQFPLSYYWLDAFVQLELLAQRQYEAPPEMTLDLEKQYWAIIKTVKGDIYIEFDAQAAPLTVNNFVFLARQGWYDGVTFFRVLPDDAVAQAGDPTNTGLGGPGYELPAEIELPHQPGAIAMARRAEVDWGLDDLDRIGHEVPVLANIRPSGSEYLMEDFYYAGGLPALMKRLINALMGVSPQEGAKTIIYLATSPEVEGVSGKYFVKGKAIPSSEGSYDRAAAARLWQISADLTGLPAG